jgi:hypothetical protein
VVLAALLFGAIGISLISRTFKYPFPPAEISPLPRFSMFDMTAIIAGSRRLGADIAWIQLLQYYGSPEKPLGRDAEFRLSWDMTKYLFGMPVKEEVCSTPGCTHEEHYHPAIGGGIYHELFDHCSRVARLDPFFDHVYLYGAGALAWNLNRPREALELLDRGIRSMEHYRTNLSKDIHQPFWQLNLYASAIIYRQSGEFDKMIAQLEVAVRHPDCPNMVKTILANIYQKEGKFAQSLTLWIAIYDSGDPSYHARATQKIGELKAILHLPG